MKHHLRPTDKDIRARIARASALTRLDGLLHPEMTGRTFEITKHQKSAVRLDRDGSPFWATLDVVQALDHDTFATFDRVAGRYAGAILAIYRICGAAP